MNIERKTLKISAFTALVLAAWGLGMAMYSGSDAIMLDGAFNLLSAVMAFTALRIAVLTAQGYNQRYPLGYFAYEPLMVLVKGISILVLVTFAVSSNIEVLLSGGREPALGSMLVYVAPAVALCVMAWWFCARACKQSDSNLLDAEKQGWLINAVLSGAIGLALLLVLALQQTPLAWLERYIDQILVITLSLLSLKDPIALVRTGFKELLLGAPDQSFSQAYLNEAKQITPPAGLEPEEFLVTKMGRRAWIYVETKASTEQLDIAAYQGYRSTLRELASKHYGSYFVDVVFVD